MLELISTNLNVIVWLAVMIVLIVIEVMTVGLTTIWFAIGAIAAVVVTLAGGGWLLQIAVFLLVSFGMLLFTRPFAMKYVNVNHTKTNYEDIIGKVVRVEKNIDNAGETESVVINGQEWSAKTESANFVIPAGSLAKVVDIKGVKLILEKYEEEKV